MGLALLPAAGLSFFLYAPEQKLRRPRPRWIPYVRPSALVMLTIASAVWIGDFPKSWYLMPVALLFFYMDNETEEALQKEKERYKQNNQHTKISNEETDGLRSPLFSGCAFLVVGVGITCLLVGNTIFSTSPGIENWTSADIFMLIAFGAAPMVAGVYQIIRVVINKPIEAVMHGKTIEQLEAEQPELVVQKESNAQPVLAHGPRDFPFHEIDYLPPHTPQNGGKITSERNQLNNMPPKILMLWNFERTTFPVYKGIMSYESWQQIGPLYMLSSQSGMSISRFFRFSMSGKLEKAFIQSNAYFEKLLAKVNDQPIKHGFIAPHAAKRHAYPLHNWVCTSDTWRDSVYSLCAHVDVVILDARGFNAERVGLAWEISCLVDHVCTSKFVVLTDPTTALGDLRNTFYKAWQDMSADSPNHNIKEKIRVLHGIDTMHFETRKRLFPEPFHRFEAGQVAQLFPYKSNTFD